MPRPNKGRPLGEIGSARERRLESDMIDVTTSKPLSVSIHGEGGPYIMVPVAQLDKVRALLDANRVFYWADEEAISLDGKPEIAFINLGHRADPALVQRLLDSIP